MDNTSHTSSVTPGNQVTSYFPDTLADSAVGCGFRCGGCGLRLHDHRSTLLRLRWLFYPLVVDPAGTGSANPAKVDIGRRVSRCITLARLRQNAAKSLIANGDTL